LLRDRVLTHADEVWSSDITYLPMRHGFKSLTAVINWFSRCVLFWRLSNTLEGRFLGTGTQAAGRKRFAGTTDAGRGAPGLRRDSGR
jgi:transposase InsO family protein